MRATDVTYVGLSRRREFSLDDLRILGVEGAVDHALTFPKGQAIRVPGKLAELLLDPQGSFRRDFVQGDEEPDESKQLELVDENSPSEVSPNEGTANNVPTDSAVDPATAKGSRKSIRSTASAS